MKDELLTAVQPQLPVEVTLTIPPPHGDGCESEARDLYLRGRFHNLKLTPPEVQQGIVYFQQAIQHDPNYALAYVGLSEAYRGLTLGGDMNSTEYMPRA